MARSEASPAEDEATPGGPPPPGSIQTRRTTTDPSTPADQRHKERFDVRGDRPEETGPPGVGGGRDLPGDVSIMRGEVAVAGASQLEIEREKRDQPEARLVWDAASAAFEEARMDQEEVDTAVVAGNDLLDGRTISNTFTAEPMGGFLKDETKCALGGLQALNYAAMRILSGAHDTAIVAAYASRNGRTLEEWTNLALDPFRVRPVGLTGPELAALQAQRFYAETAAEPEHGARVAAKNLGNAEDNPNALRADDVDAAAVEAADPRAEPLREPEVAPEAEGAAAVVLTREDLAESYTADPAHLLGMGHATDALVPGRAAFWRLRAAENAAQAAADRAGIDDVGSAVDVAEVTEIYAPHELALAEALGLAQRGKSSRRLETGAFRRDGDRPLNPSGGALAGYTFFATGLQRFVEATLQVRGEAGGRQVDDASVALAHGATGPAHQANAVAFVGGPGEVGA